MADLDERRRRIADLIAERRGIDPGGAHAAVDSDARIGELLAGPWDALRARAEEIASARECIACGTCCRSSGPTLYAEDLGLVEGGHLERTDLYTLRTGEKVSSRRRGRTFALERDLVKVRAREGGGCRYLEGSRCVVHAHRPLECRHLECWSGRNAGDLEDRPRLDRRTLYASDETALRLIEEYDVKVPAPRLRTLLEAADPEAIALIDLDHRLRAGIAARHGYRTEEQPLLLGRPALEVARAHGLEVALDEEERPVLVPVR